MVEYRKILIATDFSGESAAAETHALSLASQYGASCCLLHVIEAIEDDDDDLQAFYRGLEQRAAAQLESSRVRFDALGVPCSYQIAIGSRWRSIVEVAEAEDFDLIVMGSRDLVHDGRPVVGTTSHKVFFATRRPLLVVRASSAATPPTA